MSDKEVIEETEVSPNVYQRLLAVVEELGALAKDGTTRRKDDEKWRDEVRQVLGFLRDQRLDRLDRETVRI